MASIIDLEYRQQVLQELHSATNQPLRHDASTHPFWQPFTDAPEKIVIATESYRKITLLILQFLYLNGEDLPGFYEETEGNLLTLLADLKRAFHNGNGESKDEVYIGELFGTRIFAQPTKGEKHAPGLTQREEAYNKAAWLAEHPYEQDGEVSDDEQVEGQVSPGAAWVIGLDTIDTIWVEEDGEEVPLERLPKPSSWPGFPADWQSNPEAYQQFKQKAIDERFLDKARLEGMTAGVMVDSRGREVAVGYSSISTTIEQQRLREVIDQFDPNAAAFGILQLLVDFDKVDHPEGDKEVMLATYPERAHNQEQAAGLFALAQIMGAPAWLVIELISQGMKEKRDRENEKIIPLGPDDEASFAVTA